MSSDRVQHVLREIEVYLDDELTEEDCRRIERHLADCPECFDHEQFLVRLREIVRRKCREGAEPPEDLVERIRSAIELTRG